MYIKSWKKKKKLCKTSQKFALLAQSISNGAFSITCSNRFLHFCCCCVTLVVSDSVWPQRRQPTGLLCPWDSPGKNTGVGCHFLLQCTKVKSQSEVPQSCPTLSDSLDCDQAPLSMGFSRQEYWSGLPCPPPGHLPNPGIEPRSIKGCSLPSESPGKPQ